MRDLILNGTGHTGRQYRPAGVAVAALCGLAAMLAAPRADAVVYDYLLPGVDYGNQTGYYDVNKVFDGHDDLFCWSFSAANQLQRWQDKQYPAIIAAKGIPNGHSGMQSVYSLDIAYTFAQSWEKGTGFELRAFTWWITGQNIPGTPVDPVAEVAGPVAPGGFWADYVPPGSYLGAIVNVDQTEPTTYLFDLIKTNVEKDRGMTLSIGGHAIGLWGGGYDTEQGAYWLYITDSDDGKTILYKSGIHLDQFNHWRFNDGERFAGDVVSKLTYLDLGVVPEPAAGLLLGVSVIGLAAARRRPHH